MAYPNRGQVLGFLALLYLGGVVRSQTDLYCPAEDWQLDSTIILVCSVPRADYPSKCTTEFNTATIDKVGYDPCEVENFRTSCTAVVYGSGCSDGPISCQHNSTHYVLHRTITVDTDVDTDDDTDNKRRVWRCDISCITSSFKEALTHTQHNCEDREVVVYAVLSTPNRTVTRGSDPWTVNGSVDITRIYSSGNTYSCMWEYKRDSGSYTNISDTGPSLDPVISGVTARTGQCSFPDRPLPSVDGDYTYRVTVSPGQTRATTTLTIAKDDANVVLTIGVTVGIMLAIFIVIVIVVITWMWRRHWILPCAGEGAEQDISGENRQRLEAIEGPPPVPARQDEAGYEIARPPLSRQPRDHQPPPMYSSLDTSDIGVPSVYTAMSHYTDAASARDRVPSDSGDRSEYMEMSPPMNAAPSEDLGPDYENSGQDN